MHLPTSAIVLVFLLPFVASAQSSADEKLVQRLDPAIETVVSGGYWQAGEKEGSYRLVVIQQGWEHITNHVYLQWLEQDQDKHDYIPRKIVPIAEINEGGWRVEKAEFKLTKETWSIVISAGGGGEGQKRTVFKVIPMADFRYRMADR